LQSAIGLLTKQKMKTTEREKSASETRHNTGLRVKKKKLRDMIYLPYAMKFRCFCFAAAAASLISSLLLFFR
jgi:hypothetical protein